MHRILVYCHIRCDGPQCAVEVSLPAEGERLENNVKLRLKAPGLNLQDLPENWLAIKVEGRSLALCPQCAQKLKGVIPAEIFEPQAIEPEMPEGGVQYQVRFNNAAPVPPANEVRPYRRIQFQQEPRIIRDEAPEEED